MALFGYPTAQENDAERAVRAALAIQRALAEPDAAMPGPRARAQRDGMELRPVVVDARARCSARRRRCGACRGRGDPGTGLITVGVQRQTPGCSWPRISAPASSRAFPSRSRFSASFARAALDVEAAEIADSLRRPKEELALAHPASWERTRAGEVSSR